jgi:hypothetical protein
MKTILCAALLLAVHAASAATCNVRSGATPLPVVELYTSEGCSSCPPADRWLSTLKAEPDAALALGFHVGYWDYLGWPDRFASAEHTERQRRLQVASGAPYVYTPQVVVNGRDWRGWPRPLPARPAGPAPVIKLERSGAQQYTVSVPALDQRAAGYWAVLEDGHRSAVRAGENAGATLQHDHVVRLYRPLPPWPAGAATRWQLTLTTPADAATPRRVAFVLTDEHRQRPLQAVVLAGC